MSDQIAPSDLDGALSFVERHIGIRPADLELMLGRLGFDSLDALMSAAVPGGIRTAAELDLPEALSEEDAARELRAIAAANRPGETMIGLGYHATITPPVIRRNVLEDPSWYTAYTPYQPEISQGRLEALL
ncbi:MAG: glycine dehydrogenase (aminomethyl-transferring), partial [Nocardioides sp.]